MTEQEQAQLLPCPFCGGEGVILWGESIKCSDCGAEGPDAAPLLEAIAAWNTRHTATAEALDAMREAREALVNIRSMVVIHSSGYALDVYKCADAAIAKIEGQQP